MAPARSSSSPSSSSTSSSSSSSAPNGAATIKWKGREYQLPVPDVCSFEECKANFNRKVRIDKAIADAVPEEKQKLIKLRRLLLEMVEKQYKTPLNGVWKWQPSDLTNNTPGLYAGVRKKDGKTKIGMSFTRHARAARQDFVFAAKLMDLDEMKKIIPQELLTRIKELELPGLVFYSDKDSHLTALVLMQLCELFLACSRKCGTNTVGERLIELPSAHVREAVARRQFDPKAVDFLRNIPDGGVFCQFSWPTLPYRLQRLAENSDFLPHRLRPEPPKGGFVTANRVMEVLGPKFGRFQDSLELSPREEQLDEVIQGLDPLLEGATGVLNVEEEIRAALEPIQGENYSHYVPPTKEKLAAGARSVLEGALDSLPKEHVIMIERGTVDALETHDSTWLHSVMDFDSAIDVLPDDRLCLLRARSGHRIIITASFFVPFAEQKSTTQRFKAVEAEFVLTDLLHASGNISFQQMNQQRKRLCSFLMGLKAEPDYSQDDSQDDSADDSPDDSLDYSSDDSLDDSLDDSQVYSSDDSSDNSPSDSLDDSPNDSIDVPGYRTARRLALPDGYFAGNRRDVKVVSGPLGIGYAELLYLRERMGPTKVKKLLLAHGLLGNGLQTASPLEPTWTCPGVPAVLGIEAQTCTVEEGVPYTGMVGAKQPHHPLYGIFVCQRCHRKIQRREMAILQARASVGEITSEGQERLDVLEQRKLEHQERANAARQDAIATHGLATVQETETAKNRKFQARTNERCANDAEARKTLLKRKRDEETARQAQGKKKASGIKRKSDAKKLYPRFFMQLLTRAARIWGRVTGEKHVYWNNIVNLFDELLKREHTNMKQMKVKFLPDGRPMGYLDYAYRNAVKGILVHENPKGKLWRFLDFDATQAERKIEAGAAMDKNGQGRIAHVIKLLYSSDNASENTQNDG